MLEFSKPEIHPYIQIDTTRCTEALSELRKREDISDDFVCEPDMSETIIAMGDCRCPCQCTCTCLCECPCRCEGPCRCECKCESPCGRDG